MENIEVITKITFCFFIYLILAIFVERFVEVLVSIYNYIELKRNFSGFWNKKAEAYRARFDRLFGFQSGKTPRRNKILSWIIWRAIAEKPYPGGKEVVSADQIRHSYLQVGTRSLAFLISLGLVIAIKVQLDLDFLSIIASLFKDVTLIGVIANSAVISVLFSAAALSIGSEPLHRLIASLEDFAKRRRNPATPQAQGGGHA
ncbi:MAG: hypothetical protein D6743_19915 [Calditrichaeota bacterium]|nr:MAG: hypothetical protein D6743_19915 [Calditrichota bacterium]